MRETLPIRIIKGYKIAKFTMFQENTNFKFCQENSQNNLGKEEQSWRIYTSCFQNLTQNYSSQNSVALA